MEEHKRKKVIVWLVNCIGIAGVVGIFSASITLGIGAFFIDGTTILWLGAHIVAISSILLGVFGLLSSSNWLRKMEREIVR